MPLNWYPCNKCEYGLKKDWEWVGTESLTIDDSAIPKDYKKIDDSDSITECKKPRKVPDFCNSPNRRLF